MSHNTGFTRHQSYNNRFRTSSTTSDTTTPPPPTTTTATTTSAPHPTTTTTLEDIDVFGHSTAFGKLSREDSTQHPGIGGQRSLVQKTSTSVEERLGSNSEILFSVAGLQDALNENQTTAQDSDPQVPVPTAPGKPRRLSRQTSAGAKRQNFAASRSVSGGGQGNSTSLDSNRDDVFVDVDEAAASKVDQPGLAAFDSSLFPGKKGRELVLSDCSSVSGDPNPYNELNHKVHDTVWLCSCLHLVFFCCLPAVHAMERSDVYHRCQHPDKARRMATLATLLFVVGALLTLLFLGLVFFLAIYFSTR